MNPPQAADLPHSPTTGAAISARPAFKDKADRAISARPAFKDKADRGISARPAFEDEAVQAEAGVWGRQPPGMGRVGAAGAKHTTRAEAEVHP